ncbi:hypothetical protein D9756_011405 [Leucocoprinus leucothites]|uniref:Uncharacterized protein n=1 Tax=Leucocoprinus leucothites TaxID=201217 RepID=A0A8H5FNW6_9AGAR|nr:hypothetical protein D9756_011405 [Leucoagaricus leucothites]
MDYIVDAEPDTEIEEPKDGLQPMQLEKLSSNQPCHREPSQEDICSSTSCYRWSNLNATALNPLEFAEQLSLNSRERDPDRPQLLTRIQPPTWGREPRPCCDPCLVVLAAARSV